MAEFNADEYVQRRIKQLRAEGASDQQIIQTVSVIVGRQKVVEALEAEKQQTTK